MEVGEVSEEAHGVEAGVEARVEVPAILRAINRETATAVGQLEVGIGGAVQEVKQEKWTVKGGPGVMLTRTQLPLRLAWAFSIHKSQGMTLDCVEVSLGKVFESGQTYVALSRAKNLKSIR